MCAYPKLIAAYHVLHRLLMPRHSPCALCSLTFTRLLYLITSSTVKSIHSRTQVLFISYFSYFLVLPAAVKFFMGFATDELQPLFSIGQYMDFVLSFVLPFGFIFELPLILIILGYFNLITSRFLKTKRKIFILISFIIGAVISPTPDMFSQTMIALPMILLYETSLFVLAKIMKR